MPEKFWELYKVEIGFKDALKRWKTCLRVPVNFAKLVRDIVFEVFSQKKNFEKKTLIFFKNMPFYA